MVWLVVISRIVKLLIGSIGLRLGTVPISFEPTTLEGRMRAVASLPVLWKLGWTVYGLSSLALVAFFVTLVEKLPARAGRMVLAAVVGAAAMEILAAAIEISLLEVSDAGVYAGVERIAWLVATFGAYLLYGVAVAVTVVVMRDRRVRIAGAVLLAPMLLCVFAGLAGLHGWIEAALGSVTWLWCVFALVAARAR